MTYIANLEGCWDAQSLELPTGAQQHSLLQPKDYSSIEVTVKTIPLSRGDVNRHSDSLHKYCCKQHATDTLSFNTHQGSYYNIMNKQRKDTLQHLRRQLVKRAKDVRLPSGQGAEV
jgi:hypothetical protein